MNANSAWQWDSEPGVRYKYSEFVRFLIDSDDLFRNMKNNKPNGMLALIK